MTLYRYQQITRRLLMNDQTFAKFNDFDLQDWINIARGQIAAEGECIRNYATLPITNPTQQYSFTSIVLSSPNVGLRGVLAVRTANYSIAGGSQRVYPRSWPWFELYELCNPAPVGSPPRIYSQYGQGANGTIWVNLPDTTYILNLDTTCYPIDLVDDTTDEAIPFLWTDAIPYYAAYMGYLTVAGMQDQADHMFSMYSQYMMRARQGATPSTLSANYEQQTDPTLANKLGSQPFRSAADIGTGAQGGRSRPSR